MVKVDLPSSALGVAAAGLVALVLGGRADTKAQLPPAPVPQPRVESVSIDKFWFSGGKDSFVDGAKRTTARTYKDGRALILRCFRGSATDAAGTFDLRYQIDVPMLKSVAEDMIKKKTPIMLIVSIDDEPLEPLKARVIAHDSGASFLAQITQDALTKLAGAKHRIQVVPRHQSVALDAVTEFGTTELAVHAAPVVAACKNSAAQPSTGPVYVTHDSIKL